MGRFEGQWAITRKLASVGNCSEGRVVTVALGDPSPVNEHPQETASVAAGIKNPRSAQLNIDRIEHGLPDEPMLVLHGLVLDGATPVTGAHLTDSKRPGHGLARAARRRVGR